MKPEILNFPRQGYILTTERTLCRRASIWIGQTCNLRCTFCYFLDRIADPKHPEHAFMPLAKLKAMCDTLATVYGNNAVDIEGGEPTIYHDIVPLVRHCHDIGLKPTLITNALALDDQKCRDLKDAGLVDFLISIHSIGEAYEKLVQVSGAFQKLLRGIDHARAAGIPVRFNTVLCPEALPHLMEIAKITVEKGARVHNFINYNPFVDQKTNAKRTSERVPHYTEVAHMLLPVIDYLDANGVEVNIRYMPFCAFPAAYRKHIQNFQQIVYDQHEWESAGEVWSGARAQREAQTPLAPTVDFYNHIYGLRMQHFPHEVQAVQGQSIYLQRLLQELRTRTADQKGPRTLSLYGGGELNRAVAEAIQNDPVLAGRFQKPVLISSSEFKTADTLFGYAWHDNVWLKANPTDLIVITTNGSRHAVFEHLAQAGLGDRVLMMFEYSKPGAPFDKLFYLPELGPVDGFSDLEYAYKEYRVMVAKVMHPYCKGEKCRACSIVGICDGYHRDYAEFFGFDEAQPLELPTRIFDPRYYMKDQIKVREHDEPLSSPPSVASLDASSPATALPAR